LSILKDDTIITSLLYPYNRHKEQYKLIKISFLWQNRLLWITCKSFLVIYCDSNENKTYKKESHILPVGRTPPPEPIAENCPVWGGGEGSGQAHSVIHLSLSLFLSYPHFWHIRVSKTSIETWRGTLIVKKGTVYLNSKWQIEFVWVTRHIHFYCSALVNCSSQIFTPRFLKLPSKVSKLTLE